MPTSFPPPEFPDKLDNTILSCFDSCRHKVFREFFQHLSPLEISPDLHAGGAFAKGTEVVRLAVWRDNLPLPDALLLASRAFTKFWGDYEPPMSGGLSHAKTYENTLLALHDYFREYPPLSDPFQPYIMNGEPAIEFTFAIPMNVIHPITGDPILYCGRLDLLGYHNNLLCVRGDTEVLTLSGWIPIADLKPGVAIAQWWENGNIDFVIPSELHSPQYVGELISLAGKCELIATPDHRQLTYHTLTKRYKTYALSDLPQNYTDLRLISAGFRTDGITLPIAHVHLLIVVYLYGKLQDKGLSIRITTLAEATRLEAILKKADAHYMHSDLGSHHPHIFTLLSADNPIIFETIQTYLDSNYAFNAACFNLSGKTLANLFEELRHWKSTDNSRNNWLHRAPNKATAHLLQDLAPLANLHISVHNQNPFDWRVVITRAIRHVINNQRTTLPHNGPVYCVTVPSSNFLTRRNRKVIVTGNCMLDDKTTKGIGFSWANKWTMRGQFFGYGFACQQYEIPVQTAIIRGIAIQKTQFKYATAIINLPQWQIDRWWTEANAKAQNMVDCWNTYIAQDCDPEAFRHSYGDACTAYGGCVYEPLCTTHKPENWLSEYKYRKWDPLAKDPTSPDVT